MEGSCIIHLDLDCYYAQVEHLRLGIPSHVPLAVQQWQGLIAVNYAAREKGVTRFMRIHEALKACPDLQLVHVKTIGVSGEQHLHSEGGLGMHPEAESSSKSRLTAKACLSRYRTASSEIIALLRSLLPSDCKFEKGGCDEFFFDVTSLARSRVLSLRARQGQGQDPEALSDLIREAEASSEVQGGPIDPMDNADLLLAVGSIEARRLRQNLFEKLGYTASCGVSTNKLLSKVASAKHKPNRQALILPRGVLSLMASVKIKKIWGLGGKVGDILEAEGYTMAGEAMDLSLQVLTKIFKDAEVAVMVHEKLRGHSSDPVVPKSLPKSFASCKSFQTTSDQASIKRWLDILADELASRLEEDTEENSRRAGTLTLHYSSAASQANGSSVRIQVPRIFSATSISTSAYDCFKRLPPAQSLPVHRLSLTAGDFIEGPRANSKGSITSYFTNQASKSGLPFAAAAAAPMPPEHQDEQLKLDRDPLIGVKAGQRNGVEEAADHHLEVAAYKRKDSALEPGPAGDGATACSIEGQKLKEEEEVEEILFVVDGVDVKEQKRIFAEIKMENQRKVRKSRANSEGQGQLLGKGKKVVVSKGAKGGPSLKKLKGSSYSSNAREGAAAGDIRGFFFKRAETKEDSIKK